MASKNAIPESGSAPPVIIDQGEPGNTTNTRMGELDKVRSILFGEQIKVYEERMQQIEGQLKQNLDVLHADINEQIRALDDRFKAQYDEILELLGKEAHSRESQKDVLEKGLKDVNSVFKDFKRIQEERVNTLDKSVRATLSTEMQNIEKELDEKVQFLSVEFKEAFEKLERGALNRAQFADLLAGLAQNIAPNNSK